MKFSTTPIDGVFVLDLEPLPDERGFFARTFDAQQFRERGLQADIVQQSVSFNRLKGTLRGMHLQRRPFAETRIVRCTRGALFDVAIDLRPNSSTYKQWFGVELTAENGRSLYIPVDCAHGFVTLADNTEALYAMTHEFVPDSFFGVRWDDPAFGIIWPIQPVLMSQRDASFHDYQEPPR